MVHTLERPHTTTERKAPPGKFANFSWHFLEMCAAMCVAWMLVTLPFIVIARAAGVSDPVRELPEVTTVVATVAMSLGMAAEMRWRKHGWRCIAEMTAAMAVEAVVLIAIAAAGVFDRANLVAWFHGLMPVAMVVAMLYRLDVYTQPLTRHQHQS